MLSTIAATESIPSHAEGVWAKRSTCVLNPMMRLLSSVSKPFIRERTMTRAVTPTKVPPTAIIVTRDTRPARRRVRR